MADTKIGSCYVSTSISLTLHATTTIQYQSFWSIMLEAKIFSITQVLLKEAFEQGTFFPLCDRCTFDSVIVCRQIYHGLMPISAYLYELSPFIDLLTLNLLDIGMFYWLMIL